MKKKSTWVLTLHYFDDEEREIMEALKRGEYKSAQTCRKELRN